MEIWRKCIDIAAGFNVIAKNKDGATALWMATQQGHAEIVQALLDAKTYWHYIGCKYYLIIFLNGVC